MTAETSALIGTAGHAEEANPTLSFTAWVSNLTDPARKQLLASRRQRPSRLAFLLQAHDQDGLSPLSEIRGLLAEVRDFLLSQRVVRDYYSTEQAAQILGKAPWTVREWCRQGRVHAEKRRSGRGRALDWAIFHAELQRIQAAPTQPQRPSQNGWGRERKGSRPRDVNPFVAMSAGDRT